MGIVIIEVCCLGYQDVQGVKTITKVYMVFSNVFHFHVKILNVRYLQISKYILRNFVSKSNNKKSKSINQGSHRTNSFFELIKRLKGRITYYIDECLTHAIKDILPIK